MIRFLSLCALLFALASAAWADAVVLPQTPAQALDLGAMVLEMLVIVAVGKFLFFLAVVVFFVLHIALLLMIFWGLIKRRFWHAGIRFCLIGLALMYVALGFIIHDSRQQSAQRIEIEAQIGAWGT